MAKVPGVTTSGTTRDATLAAWMEFNMPGALAFGHDVIYVAGGDGFSVRAPERRRVAAGVAEKGSSNIHGIWIDSDETICLARCDRTVGKLTQVPA